MYNRISLIKDEMVKFIASLGKWPTITAIIVAAIVAMGFAFAGLIAGVKAAKKQYADLRLALADARAWLVRHTKTLWANSVAQVQNAGAANANAVAQRKSVYHVLEGIHVLLFGT